MESTVKRGPWLEEEFTKEGESYIVNDGYVEGFRASITPREGFFDLEVYRNEYEYVRDDDIGVHVEGHREEYLNSRELTVDNIRTAVRDFEITVPDSLANELTEWQEKYWDGNEIEMAYGSEGVAAPEETSERLRVEFGAALAESQGIADYESPKITVEGFDGSVSRLPFIEEALSAGATVNHTSVRHDGSDWTVVSFKNAEGTYLVKGEDVYVTRMGAQEAQASIEADPVALPGINDLRLAGDIEIKAPEIRGEENKVEPRGRSQDYALSM